jgi:hypothetical protein
MSAAGDVEPLIFRFSEVGIIVRRIPLMSATRIAALNLTRIRE